MRSDDGSIEVTAAKVKWLSLRVDESHYQVNQLYRLHKQEYDECDENLVARPDERNDEYAAHCIYEQDVSIVEKEVEKTEEHKEYHSP